MTTAKLTYFNYTDIAEPVRFLLTYGNVVFEDERISRDHFHARKDSLPMGKVPVLQIDGHTLHQSLSICRYLGRRLGLAGRGEWDAVQCEMMADTVNDVRLGLVRWYFERHVEAKAAKREVTMQQTGAFLDRLEAVAAKNAGFLVLPGQVTYPDVMLASVYDYLNHMAGCDLFSGRPTLRTLCETIRATPTIKKYLETSPPHPPL